MATIKNLWGLTQKLKPQRIKDNVNLPTLGTNLLTAALGAYPVKVNNTGLWTKDFITPTNTTSSNKNNTASSSSSSKQNTSSTNNLPAYKYTSNINNVLSNLQSQYKPQTISNYTSAYEKQINSLVDSIVNRKDFTYNVKSDPLYNQYKTQYHNEGNTAMKDTVAQAALLTGGYGNSYAATAGNQTYQSYLNKLNNVVPDLYELAYSKYKSDGDKLYNQLDMYGNLEKTAYNKYLDKVSQVNTANKTAYQQIRDKIKDANSVEEKNYKNYLNQYNNALKVAQASTKSQEKAASATQSTADKKTYYNQLNTVLSNSTKYNTISKNSQQGLESTVRSGYQSGFLTKSQAKTLLAKLGLTL